MYKQVKVVIDTNILISSLWGDKPKEIIELWDKNKMLVIVSQKILDEYFSVLNRFELTEEDIEDITILFSNPNKTLFVEPKLKINLIKEDPEDNKFIEYAIEGNADYIISGDRQLLKIGNIKSVKIINISKFLHF